MIAKKLSPDRNNGKKAIQNSNSSTKAKLNGKDVANDKANYAANNKASHRTNDRALFIEELKE